MQLQSIGRLAFFLGVAMAAVGAQGCVVEPDHGASAGGGNVVPQAGTPTASGCVAGDKRECSITSTHGGVTDCVVASQICHDDAWGACGDATAFCTSDAIHGMIALAATGDAATTFVSAWNMDPAKLQIGVTGLANKGKEQFELGGIGSGSAAIAADGAPPIAMQLSNDPRALVLEGEASVSGSFLRVHSAKLQLQIPVQTLHVVVHVDDACALTSVDVALFVDATTTTAEESAMLGAATDTNGSATGWWLTFTGTADAHGH